MCFSSSSSKSSSTEQVYDERVGAENNSTAFRAVTTGSGNIQVDTSSDEVAATAIDAATNTAKEALTASTEFIGNALTQFFNSVDKSLDRSNTNIANTQKEVSNLLANQAQSSDDRVVNLIKMSLFAGVATVFIFNIKNLKGIFK